jgi:hypothetical protein
MECMHIVGGIFIKDKCQLCVKLHVALLFMSLFLWIFICILHVYLYYYSI